MDFALFLAGLVNPATLRGNVIDTAGIINGAGVASMWAQICATLPFCDVGNFAPEFFFEKITNFVFGLIVGVGVLVIIYAGMKLITSAGDEQGMAEAKKTLIYVAIGILLAIMARSIILYVGFTLLPGLVGN